MMMKQLSVCLCLSVCHSIRFTTISYNFLSPYISTNVTAVTFGNVTALCLGKSGKSDNLEGMVKCLIVSSLM